MKILCVDDDDLVRSVTIDLLRDLGHFVIGSGSGQEAMRRMRRCGSEIGMMITDIRMPGGYDGVRTAEMAREVVPDLPVIYFTGYSDVDPGTDARTILLRKPCSIGSLSKAIAGLKRPDNRPSTRRLRRV